MRNAVTSSLFFGLTAVSLLAGCPDRTISEANPQQGRVEYKDIPVTVNRDIDILFIIDDSPSMLDKQTILKANFPNFINVLNTIEGGLPNVHLGVVSSDVGTKGADDATAGPGIGSGPGSCSGNGKAGNLQTNGTALVNGRAEALKKILVHFPGRDIVELHVWDERQGKTIVCTIPERVNADAGGLHTELMELFGGDSVETAA